MNQFATTIKNFIARLGRVDDRTWGIIIALILAGVIAGAYLVQNFRGVGAATSGVTFISPAANDTWFYGWERRIAFTLDTAVTSDTTVRVVICPDNNGSPVCIDTRVVNDYVIHPSDPLTHSIIWSRAGYDIDGKKIGNLSKFTISLSGLPNDVVSASLSIIDHPDTGKVPVPYIINPNSLLGEYPVTAGWSLVAQITGENLTYGRWMTSEACLELPIVGGDLTLPGGGITVGDGTDVITVPGGGLGGGTITLPVGDNATLPSGGFDIGLGGGLTIQSISKLFIQQAPSSNVSYPSVARRTTHFSNGQSRDTRILYVAVKDPSATSGGTGFSGITCTINSDGTVTCTGTGEQIRYIIPGSGMRIIGVAMKNFYSGGKIIPQHMGGEEIYSLYVMPGTDLPDGFYNEFYMSYPCKFNDQGQPTTFGSWIKSNPKANSKTYADTSDDLQIGISGIPADKTVRVGEVRSFQFPVPVLGSYAGEPDSSKVGSGAIYLEHNGYSDVIASFDVTKGEMGKYKSFEHLFGSTSVRDNESYPMENVRFKVVFRERSSSEEVYTRYSETFTFAEEGYEVKFITPASDTQMDWPVDESKDIVLQFQPKAGITDPFRVENRLDVNAVLPFTTSDGRILEAGYRLQRGIVIPADYDVSQNLTLPITLGASFQCSSNYLECSEIIDDTGNYIASAPHDIKASVGTVLSGRHYYGGKIRFIGSQGIFEGIPDDGIIRIGEIRHFEFEVRDFDNPSAYIDVSLEQVTDDTGATKNLMIALLPEAERDVTSEDIGTLKNFDYLFTNFRPQGEYPLQNVRFKINFCKTSACSDTPLAAIYSQTFAIDRENYDIVFTSPSADSATAAVWPLGTEQKIKFKLTRPASYPAGDWNPIRVENRIDFDAWTGTEDLFGLYGIEQGYQILPADFNPATDIDKEFVLKFTPDNAFKCKLAIAPDVDCDDPALEFPNKEYKVGAFIGTALTDRAYYSGPVRFVEASTARPVTATYYTQMFDLSEQGQVPNLLDNFVVDFDKGNGDVEISLGFFKSDGSAVFTSGQLGFDTEGYYKITVWDPSEENPDLLDTQHSLKTQFIKNIDSGNEIAKYRVRIKMSTPDAIATDITQPWVGELSLGYSLEVCDADETNIGVLNYTPLDSIARTMPSTGTTSFTLLFEPNDVLPIGSEIDLNVSLTSLTPGVSVGGKIFANPISPTPVIKADRTVDPITLTFTSDGASNGTYQINVFASDKADDCFRTEPINSLGRITVTDGPEPEDDLLFNVTIFGQPNSKPKSPDNSMPIYSLQFFTDAGNLGRAPVLTKTGLITDAQGRANFTAELPDGTYRVFANSNRHLFKEATEPGSTTTVKKLIVNHTTVETYDIYFAGLLLGDLNANNAVDSTDLTNFLGHWFTSGYIPTDFNNDGQVGASDFTLFTPNYFKCGDVLPSESRPLGSDGCPTS